MLPSASTQRRAHQRDGREGPRVHLPPVGPRAAVVERIHQKDAVRQRARRLRVDHRQAGIGAVEPPERAEQMSRGQLGDAAVMPRTELPINGQGLEPIAHRLPGAAAVRAEPHQHVLVGRLLAAARMERDQDAAVRQHSHVGERTEPPVDRRRCSIVDDTLIQNFHRSTLPASHVSRFSSRITHHFTHHASRITFHLLQQKDDRPVPVGAAVVTNISCPPLAMPYTSFWMSAHAQPQNPSGITQGLSPDTSNCWPISKCLHSVQTVRVGRGLRDEVLVEMFLQHGDPHRVALERKFWLIVNLTVLQAGCPCRSRRRGQ